MLAQYRDIFCLCLPVFIFNQTIPKRDTCRKWNRRYDQHAAYGVVICSANSSINVLILSQLNASSDCVRSPLPALARVGRCVCGGRCLGAVRFAVPASRLPDLIVAVCHTKRNIVFEWLMFDFECAANSENNLRWCRSDATWRPAW